MKKRCISICMVVVMLLATWNIPMYAEEISVNNQEEKKSFEIDGTVKAIERTEGDYNYAYGRNGDLILTKYHGSETDVIVPVTINGSQVDIVDAFENCKNLTSVTLPDGIAGIGESAFKNCTGLAVIKIPDKKY